MLFLSKKFNYTILLGLLLSLFLFTGNVSAAACKGMTQNSCTTATSCSWVKTYKTKKGVKVDAYCRNKANKSAVTKTKSKTKSKTATTKEAKDTKAKTDTKAKKVTKAKTDTKAKKVTKAKTDTKAKKATKSKTKEEKK